MGRNSPRLDLGRSFPAALARFRLKSRYEEAPESRAKVKDESKDESIDIAEPARDPAHRALYLARGLQQLDAVRRLHHRPSLGRPRVRRHRRLLKLGEQQRPDLHGGSRPSI